jgi:hypothetical protein
LLGQRLRGRSQLTRVVLGKFKMWPTGGEGLSHTWYHGIGDLMWELWLIGRVLKPAGCPVPRQGEIILRFDEVHGPLLDNNAH